MTKTELMKTFSEEIVKEFMKDYSVDENEARTALAEMMIIRNGECK